MADNFVTNPGAGGSTFASDDISSVQYPRVKLIHGADGTNDGDVSKANPMPMTPIGIATNGLSIARTVDLDETKMQVKASAGAVYGMWITNRATATRWVKFYNAASASVTVGTTTPAITIGIPGNTTDNITGIFNVGGIGIGFATAITVAATTGFADNDTGAPGANDLTCNVFYV